MSFVDTAGPAASIAATAGTPQSTQVANPFASDLAALVTDGSGNPVPGASVTFSAPAGGGSGVFADGGTPGPTDTETTNASGVATSTPFTANTAAGSYSVDATVSGVAVPAVFSLTNTPGPASASTSAIAANPDTVPADGGTASNITVTLDDQYGNPVPGRAVTVAQNGSSIVHTVNGVTDSTGTAAFQATDSVGESVTVKATDATDSLSLSTPVTFTTKPLFTADTPPTTGTAGTPYAGYTFAATGFPTPTYGIASGTLPTGLTLGANGALTGTPTSAGVFTFTVKASNGTTPATTPPTTITVANPPNGPDVAVGLLRVAPLVSGRDDLYLVSVTNNGRVATSGPLTLSGTLPAGLSPGALAGIGWQCTATHQTFACTLRASLPARATSFLALAVHVTAPAGNVVVTTVTLGPPDGNPANNHATDTSTVVAPPRR